MKLTKLKITAHICFSLTCARKGCLRMSCPVILSSGFFFNRLSMKDMAFFERWEGKSMTVDSTWIKGNVHLKSFSLFICDLCDRKVLFQLGARRLVYPSTKDPRTYYTKFLPKFKERYSQRFHSMSFFFQYKWQPIRNHRVCWLHSSSQYFLV